MKVLVLIMHLLNCIRELMFGEIKHNITIFLLIIDFVSNLDAGNTENATKKKVFFKGQLERCIIHSSQQNLHTFRVDTKCDVALLVSRPFATCMPYASAVRISFVVVWSDCRKTFNAPVNSNLNREFSL